MNYYKSNIKIRPDNKVFYDFKGDLHENKFNLIKKIIFILYISDSYIEIFSIIFKCNGNAIRCFIDSIDI